MHAHLPYISEKNNVCLKVFVECIQSFGEFKEAASSSFQLEPLTPKASFDAKKLKRPCT